MCLIKAWHSTVLPGTGEIQNGIFLTNDLNMDAVAGGNEDQRYRESEYSSGGCRGQLHS